MSKIRILAVAAMLVGVALVGALLRRPTVQPLSVAVTTGSGQSVPGQSRDGVDGADPHASAPAGGGVRRAKPDLSNRTALLGSVVAPVQAVLSVRAPSRIRDVLVAEGQVVRAGQGLVNLDPAELTSQEATARAAVRGADIQVKRARVGLRAQELKADADVQAAESGLKQAQGHLQQALLARQSAVDEQHADQKAAEVGVDKALTALARARETVRSLEELAKIGGVSRSDLDSAKTQQQLAQSDLDSARAQVDRTKAGVDGLPYLVALAQRDVAGAQLVVDQAQTALHTARAARVQAVKAAQEEVYASQAAASQAGAGLAGARLAESQTHLLSPIGGLVTLVSARSGETAQPGAPLVTVVSLVGLRVDALVPARLLALLHVGQHADVTSDTSPGRIFGAVISDIARIAEPDGRTFRVKLRLLDSPPLRPGQTARISIKTGP